MYSQKALFSWRVYRQPGVAHRAVYMLAVTTLRPFRRISLQQDQRKVCHIQFDRLHDALKCLHTVSLGTRSMEEKVLYRVVHDDRSMGPLVYGCYRSAWTDKRRYLSTLRSPLPLPFNTILTADSPGPT